MPLAVTDRLVGADEPAFGVPLGHSWPSPHAEAAAEVARRAVEALGIDEGPSHTQLRISRGGPEVIEVSARLGGGHDAELVELVTGVDLNGLALAAALGRPLAAERDRRRASGRRSAAPRRASWSRRPGELESVEVPQGLKGVVSTRIYREPGHVFGPLRRPSDRAGAVLAAGATPEEALPGRCRGRAHTLRDGSAVEAHPDASCRPAMPMSRAECQMRISSNVVPEPTAR